MKRTTLKRGLGRQVHVGCPHLGQLMKINVGHNNKGGALRAWLPAQGGFSCLSVVPWPGKGEFWLSEVVLQT